MAPSVEGAGVALNVRRARRRARRCCSSTASPSDAEAMAPVAQALAARGARDRLRPPRLRRQRRSGALPRHDGRGAGAGRRRAARRARRRRRRSSCGDGFGALVALDLAKRHRALVRAVVALATRRCSCSCPRRPSASRPSTPSSRRRVREGGPAGGRRGVARRPRRRRGARARPRRAPRPSSPTTRGWRAGRSPAASCARWTARRRAHRPVRRRRTSWPRPTRSPALLPAARRADDGDLAAAARSAAPSP